MELRHLRYFAAAAALENFTRAARTLHIAQTALSQRMQDLEQALGIKLFERHGRGIRLTPAGRYYREEVDQILARIEAAGDAARQIQRGEVGSLRMAILETLAQAGPLPALLQELHRCHPGLHLKLVGMPSLAQHDALRARTLDVGLIAHHPRHPLEAPEIRTLPVLELPIHALLPRNHPLAGRSSLRLEDLKDLAFIWPEAEAATSYWRIFRDAFEGRGWKPQVMQEASSFATTTSLVAAGYGCALGISVEGHSGKAGIVQVPILDLDLRMGVHLVWHRDNPSPALQRFLEVARRVLETPRLP